MIKIYPSDRHSKVTIKGIDYLDIESDEIENRPCFHLEDSVFIEDILDIPIEHFPDITTLAIGSRKKPLEYFKFYELTRENDDFYTSIICTLYPLQWTYPWDINTFFETIEKVTAAVNDVNDQNVVFINELDEDFSYYHFTIRIHSKVVPTNLESIIHPQIKTLIKIHKQTCSIMGETPRKEDLIELKPNFFGLGVNINALLRWCSKKISSK
ncbi:MAG TPA: hypothetical protein VI298_10025 [Geobacteraceae bacterium]